jgi:hypothetical protein
MQNENDVPIFSRYLMLATRVSTSRFEKERSAAIKWCEQNSEKLDAESQRALYVLENTMLSENTLAFIQYSCYADIKPGRTYNTAFVLDNPTEHSNTKAVLKVAIYYRRVPLLSLSHGHHHLVVLDFPVGASEIITSMSIDNFDGGVSPAKIGLCDLDCLDEISAHRRLTNSWYGHS